MSEVQQAIFTSARTERMDGYQLAAVSAGVNQEQQDELSAFGPAHDSLLAPQSRIGSINFHRLQCGTYCLSKTVPAGAEYSGRSGPRIYSTCLLLTGEQFDRFSNQPFRVLDAAIAGGNLRVARRFGDTLPTIRLRGRASVALASLLEPLSDPTVRKVVLALASAMCRGKLVVQHCPDLRLAMDRVFNILPVECRTDTSFTTGLRHSSGRPFDVQPSPEEEMLSRTAARELNAELLNLQAPQETPPSGWWAMIDELMERGRVADLMSLLAEPRAGITIDALPTWSESVTHSP